MYAQMLDTFSKVQTHLLNQRMVELACYGSTTLGATVYSRCSSRERQVMDLLMQAGVPTDVDAPLVERFAIELKISIMSVKHNLTRLGMRYGVDSRRYNFCCRLVYLRAIELGLIQEYSL